MGSRSARQRVVAKAKQPAQGPDHKHFVQFYSDDKSLLGTLSRYIGSALGAGDAGVVIATEEHRRELAKRLAARGFDLDRSIAGGRYLALDAAETLDRVTV